MIAREAVKRMSTKSGGKGGAIVNVGSISARYGGLPSDVVYASSKGAVDSMTKGLAHEYAEHGIRVNCVRPGLIATDIWERSIGIEAAIELGKTGSMLKRIGQPEEIATMALWLCSEEASYVTAAIYDVDGGRGTGRREWLERGYRTTAKLGDEPMSGIKVMNLGDAEVYEDETVISRRLVRRVHGSEEMSLNGLDLEGRL